MKQILTLLLLLAAIFSDAQIPATTSNGRKVMLNTDGTWQYVTSSENYPTSNCEKQHIGNVTVINHNQSDLYFYYYRPMNEVFVVRVKGSASKTINDVCSADWCGEHKWVALYEQLDNPNSIESAKNVIANGKFYVEKCGNKQVEIDD